MSSSGQVAICPRYPGTDGPLRRFQFCPCVAMVRLVNIQVGVSLIRRRPIYSWAIEAFDAGGSEHRVVSLDTDIPVKFLSASAEWRANSDFSMLWIPGRFQPTNAELSQLILRQVRATLPELTGDSQPVELGERCAQELAGSSVSTGPSGSSVTHQSSYSSYYPSQ